MDNSVLITPPLCAYMCVLCAHVCINPQVVCLTITSPQVQYVNMTPLRSCMSTQPNPLDTTYLWNAIDHRHGKVEVGISTSSVYPKMPQQWREHCSHQ